MESETAGLLRALARLDEVLRRAVAAAREAYASAGSMPLLPGLYVDHADVERLLGREPGGSLLGDLPALADVGEDPRLAWLQATFGLSLFELQVVVVAIAPEIDLRYERIYAYLQDDVTRKRPTVDLALHLLSQTPETRLADRAAFATDAALIRNELVRLLPPDGASEPPLLAHALKVDDQVVRMLLGGSELDRRLGGVAELVEPEGEEDEDVLPGDAGDRLGRLVVQSRASRHGLRLYFRGASSASRRRAAESLAARVGMRLLAVDLVQLLSHRLEIDGFLRLLFREAWLQHAIVLFDGVDRLDRTAGSGEARIFDQLAAFESAEADIVVLGGERPWVPVARGMTGVLTVPIPVPGFDGRLEAWRRRLAEMGVSVGADEVATLAERFRLTSDQIADAVTSAERQAAWRAARSTSGWADDEDDGVHASSEVTLDDLFAAARGQSSSQLDSHALKIRPVQRWDDIVVPPETVSQLRDMCSWVSHRQRVLGDWGFERRLSYGKGLAALFFGPSGTGKTMAAEIIAGELGLDLFKIDLSSVVSKYIGETEKNLAAIFRAAQDINGILLFDEADALYGKRSEVRDSHDRYANIEISFLLQQMEQYEGIAILATNLRQNMDEAFIRRLQFAVEFPFPDAEDRSRIWEVHFPAEAPRDADIDFALLGREFRIAGGNIKNAVLAAAFMAAEQDAPIGMDHILRATRRELQKMGRVVTPAGSA
jgi:SpoVK/Ycf46/Vps4 family AAA+-type ATPase